MNKTGKVHRALSAAFATVFLMTLALIAACAQPAQPAPSAPSSSAATAPQQLTQPAAKPIKVSIGMDHTGPSSGGSLHVFRGAEHYFRSINDEGGIDGTRLDVMWSDTQYKVPVELEYYKKARDQGTVLHMISSTPAGIALVQPAADDKMAVVNASGDSGFMMPPRTVFASNVPYAYQASASLKWFLDSWKEIRSPRVVWFGWDNPAIKNPGALIEPWLNDKLARSDGMKYEWGGAIYTAQRPPDFSTYLLKLKEAKPDVVVFGMDPVDGGALARDASRLGLSREWSWIFLHSVGFGPDTIKIAGPEALEGWLYPSGVESVSAELPGTGRIKDVQNRYQGFVYDDQNYVLGWVAASIGAEAIKLAAKQAGVAKLDRQAVLDAMYRVKELNTGGITAPLSLSKDKVYSLDAVKIWRIAGGKSTVATDWIKVPRFADGL